MSMSYDVKAASHASYRTLLSIERPPVVIDHFRVMKQVLTRPDMYHDAFWTRYPQDCFKLITKQHVHQVAQKFFANIGAYYATLTSPTRLNVFYDEQSYTVIHKHAGSVRMFVFFRALSWSGSFKTVKLGLKIDAILSPCGFTKTDNQQEILNEIKIRTHAPLAGLSTPLYNFHTQKDVFHFMIHGWASEGSLADFLKKPRSMVEKDHLVTLLLDKMSLFHKHAVHKDLSISNILVDHTSGVLQLYLNDFGCSILGEDPLESKVMSTRSMYLAPEMIRRSFGVISEYDWEEVFEGPFTQEDWVKHERFQVAVLISEIYLGQNLYQKYHRLKKPIFYKSYEEIRADNKLCYQLERYFEDRLEELKSVYYRAFGRFYWTLLDDSSYKHRLPYGRHNMSRPDPMYRGTRFPDLSEDLVLTNQDDFTNPALCQQYDDLFEEIYCDESKRGLLDTSLDETGRAFVESFYKKAFSNLKSYYFKALAKFKADCDDPMTEIIDEVLGSYEAPYKDQLRSRLVALLPLLDYDPTKRPPFETIKEALGTIL